MIEAGASLENPRDEPPPRLGEMLLRVLMASPQDCSARTVEWFGWYDLALGLVIFLAPLSIAGWLHLPKLNQQAEDYIRLVGLLVCGLGLLYVVSGRLNARGFVFASMVDRPMVPFVMGVLWWKGILPGALAAAFSVSDFGGFLWTLSAWRRERRADGSCGSGFAAGLFGFVSGVVRNARTFHPDGRMVCGTVTSLQPADRVLACAAGHLEGADVLMRFGMGLMKTGMPEWLAKIIPDAPSVSMRFFSADEPGEVRLQRRPGSDLDLLCTAGGDRLWKLVLNLATGGFSFGLHRFNYFRNVYYADVPYSIHGGGADVYVRLVAAEDLAGSGGTGRSDVLREEGLTHAVEGHGSMRLEAQSVAGGAFVPFAEIRLEREFSLDQETLHFEPVAGRGFSPHGFLTDLRRKVYPASVEARPASVFERKQRDGDGLITRLERYYKLPASTPLEGGTGQHVGHPRLRLLALALSIVILLAVIYLAVRFTRDKPVDYADDEMHFKYGSTGGERTMGIPYWFWVALPEIFPEQLPDKKAGHGYQSFGMIYEAGKDPRYDLPVGTSMRNVRGIDVVYLNCAVCHATTVRKTPGGEPVVVAGAPANGLNLGAFEHFLTTIPLDQKFTPQRMLDEIDAIDGDPKRLIAKPDFINRLIFEFYATYVMREKMLMLRQRLGFMHPETWGPGRVDTFNAPKALLNFNMEHADPKELTGNADFPSVWNQAPREGMHLHWDGNNTSVNERNLSAAFGTGAYPPTLDPKRVLRMAGWLLTAKPLAYEFPIDQALASQGAPIYAQYCAACHGTREAPFRSSPQRKDEYVGTVVPIDKIGTDRSRLDSYTYLVAANQGTIYAGYEKDWGFKPDYPQRFSHFRKTDGYANMPLDGIWLRAPYLHNGSVPSLRELLEPAAKRSKTFYRGNDVYDPANVGFVSHVPEQNGTTYFLFDTSVRGNGNQGHEGPAYGTELSGPDKSALLEYLKTF